MSQQHLTPDDSRVQEKRVAQYRRNLAHLLRQAAHYGGEAHVPVKLFNDIEECRKAIRRTKRILREHNIIIDDHPDDGPNVIETDDLDDVPCLSVSSESFVHSPAGVDFSDPSGAQSNSNVQSLFLAPQERRTRAQMLDKVRATWMPLLDETLQDVVRMDLGLAANAALVDGPRKRLRQPGQAERALASGTPISAVFDDQAGELLILGDPGSGKTTMLLELARTLIDRAERELAHPIPVIFNLSTWAEQRAPLAEWLVDELNKRYDVSKQIGRPWVEEGALLPLLDGLDEVAQDQRAACVAAINAYRAAHGPLRLVVCSRSDEYAALAAQLRLQGAVVIQPLDMDQIDAALARAGDRLADVRLAIRDDADLQELAKTPLLLSVMIAAYAGRDPLAQERFATLDARRADLFAAYVDRMFAHRPADERCPRARTLHYLTWLAKSMVQRSQTVFYIEQLQPDWLPRWQRWATVLVVYLSSIAIGGIGGALTGSLAGWLINGLSNGLRIGRAVGLIGGSLLGLDNAASPVAIVERLHWSWRQTLFAVRRRWLRGAGIGCIVGIGIGFIAGRSIGLTSGLIVGLGGGVGGSLVGILGYGLVGGLSGIEIPLKATPNQGIRQSARNALLAGLGLVFVFGLGFALVFGLSNGLEVKTDSGIGRGLLFGFLMGLSLTLLGGLSLGLVVGVLRYGGLTCLKHFILRILIWRNGDAPWNYAAFLDSAADRILLRKVGGGYLFLHRMLMEYFAALKPEGAADDP